MGPIHYPKQYNPTTDKLERSCTWDGHKRIMIYADMNKINNYIKNK
jgi:hypothetical protein